MTREEAKQYLVDVEVRGLSWEQRASLLLDWWSIDSNDAEFSLLPEPLQKEIETTDEPGGDLMAKRYIPLLAEALRSRLAGVTTHWLSSRVSMLKGRHVEVEGTNELLEPCPCCRYKTLPGRGDYDICRVCFWEDDGIDDVDRHSAPNHMSLMEARANFDKYGVVAERFRDKVASDARERYVYSARAQ